ERFLGVAFSPPDAAREDAARGHHAPLPGALREAAEVARLYPRRRLLLAAGATADAFAGAAGSASVIHIAAHGLADLVEPARSVIVLAPVVPTAGGPASDHLSAAWIAGLRLRSPLVVLSA